MAGTQIGWPTGATDAAIITAWDEFDAHQTGALTLAEFQVLAQKAAYGHSRGVRSGAAATLIAGYSGTASTLQALLPRGGMSAPITAANVVDFTTADSTPDWVWDEELEQYTATIEIECVVDDDLVWLDAAISPHLPFVVEPQAPATGCIQIGEIVNEDPFTMTTSIKMAGSVPPVPGSDAIAGVYDVVLTMLTEAGLGQGPQLILPKLAFFTLTAPPTEAPPP